MTKYIALCASLLLLGMPTQSVAQSPTVVLESFETYDMGAAPQKWKRPHKKSRSILDLPAKFEKDQDFVEVIADGSNKVLRVFSQSDSEQIVLMNGDSYNWDLPTHPKLAWKWKALQLPEGAREDKSKRNDSGAALYVVFKEKDWLGRPNTLKYVYSSSLPLEKVAKHGALKVVVVSNMQSSMNEWISIERNVIADYRRLFGKNPSNPLYIMIWSDSDNTKKTADVYFDDIEIRQ